MRTAKSVGCAIAFLAAVGAVATGQSANSQASAVVSGVVIDAITRQPLKEVEVRLRGFGSGQPGGGASGQSVSHPSSATTDAAGHFVVDGLAPGRYFVTAMRPGYVGQRVSGGGSTGGRSLTVAPDQHSDDIIVELIPGAKISGLIKNGDGKPMPDVSVEVVKHFQSGSGVQLGSVGGGFTDAAGEFRVTGLTAGRYYLRAIPPTMVSEVAASAPAAVAKPVVPVKPKTFAPTYYPNGVDAASASLLTVRAGDDLAGMDITLADVHAVKITGRILRAETSAPSSGANVTLISNEATTSQREAVSDAKGNFEIKDVPPGDYVLVARVEPANAKSRVLWGQRPLHVGDSNLRNANCLAGPGVQVSGRIHVDDKSNVDLSRLGVNLRPEGNSSVAALMPDVESPSVQADGTFTFFNVPEGSYILDVDRLPLGYYLKSTGSIDILETGVTVAHNQAQALIDLALNATAAQLSGTVSNDQMPVSGAQVLLLPKGSRGNQSRFFRQSMTDRSGHFSIKNIIPGEYRVLAFEGVDRSSLTDPDFLQQFADSGEAVRIADGATLSVNLDATPADETGR
jgi:protocatechuate 3,4-dioxygenase beta subunit